MKNSRDSPRNSVSSQRVINRLLKDLCNKIKPSEESIKEKNASKKKIGKFKYAQFDDNYVCKAYEAIPLSSFEDFIDKLQIPDDGKDLLLHEQIKTGKQEGIKRFQFENGEGKILLMDSIVTLTNDNVELAFAMYDLSFKLEEKVSMSQSKKTAFSSYCQVEFFTKVDDSCKRPKSQIET